MNKKALAPFVVRTAEANPQDVWAGETFGQKVFPKLVGLIAAGDGNCCVVDLSGTSIVTASAFRSSLRALREYVNNSLHAPTIFCNASAEIEEEAQYVAARFGECYLFATFKSGTLKTPRIVGQLDESLLFTLSLLGEQGESNAKGLFEKTGSPGVTAWHNRLADLAARGLVVVSEVGRSKSYRSLLKE